MSPQREIEPFPALKHKALWEGNACMGMIQAELRGIFVVMFCGGCGEVLAAIDPKLYREIVRLVLTAQQASIALRLKRL